MSIINNSQALLIVAKVYGPSKTYTFTIYSTINYFNIRDCSFICGEGMTGFQRFSVEFLVGIYLELCCYSAI